MRLETGQIAVAFQNSLPLTMSGRSASREASKSSRHPSDFGQLTALAIANHGSTSAMEGGASKVVLAQHPAPSQAAQLPPRRLSYFTTQVSVIWQCASHLDQSLLETSSTHVDYIRWCFLFFCRIACFHVSQQSAFPSTVFLAFEFIVYFSLASRR